MNVRVPAAFQETIPSLKPLEGLLTIAAIADHLTRLETTCSVDRDLSLRILEAVNDCLPLHYRLSEIQIGGLPRVGLGPTGKTWLDIPEKNHDQ